MADAGRVIAGSAAGHRLVAPGEGTRPLGDRVKQTLFAILEPDLSGVAFLDLFAGSGAAGIEALSRGAASAVFVERDAGAARVIEANLRSTGLAGPAAAVVVADVRTWLGRGGGGLGGMSGARGGGGRAEDGAAAGQGDGVPSGGVEAGRVGLHGPFGVVFADPPYADTNVLVFVIERLAGPDAPLVAGARVVVKHFWRDRPPDRVGLLASERERRFGETALTFYRRGEEVG